jgi:hypothetical protein
MSLMDILSPYAQRPTSTEDDFDEVVRQVSPQDLGAGLASAFRSDRTPPFAEMAQRLFEHSQSSQRSGLLTQLLRTLGPSVIASVAGSALSKVRGASDKVEDITETEADGFTPDEVRSLAGAAEQKDAGVLDRIGALYAEHPQVVKTLGGTALALALGHLAGRTKR